MKMKGELGEYNVEFEKCGFTWAEPVIMVKKWYGYKTVFKDENALLRIYDVRYYTPDQYRDVFVPLIKRHEDYLKAWIKETK